MNCGHSAYAHGGQVVGLRDLAPSQEKVRGGEKSASGNFMAIVGKTPFFF